MNARELILLSSYSYPGQSPMTLSEPEMAAWMNAYSLLWHPAALWGAAEPPRVDVPYDYEDPQPNHVYGVPDEPPLMMAEDWEEKVAAAGAKIVRAGSRRTKSLEKALETYRQLEPSAEAVAFVFTAKGEAEPSIPDGLPPADEIQRRLVDLPIEKVRPFFAIGLAYLLQATLAEAMEHENLLEVEDFWREVQCAVAGVAGLPVAPPEPYAPLPDDYAAPAIDESQEESGPPADAAATEPPSDQGTYPDDSANMYGDYQDYSPAYSQYQIDPGKADPWEAWLYAAAQRILSAREVLYPVTIYLLDFFAPGRDWDLTSQPASFQVGMPVNLLAPSEWLERWKQEQPESFDLLRDAVDREAIELCGGDYRERPDNLLPIESQCWNLRQGREVAEALLGRPPEVFARAEWFYGHPQMPLFLSTHGYSRAVFLPFDDAALPHYQSTVVAWPSPDGKQVDAFVREPYDASTAETWFNLGYYLFRTIREDHSATVALLHRRAEMPQPWYEDFLELCRYGPIMGEWFTLSRYMNEVMAGEYGDVQSADDFHFDYLSRRVPDDEHTEPVTPHPVSAFARHVRLRRLLDSCWSLAAMLRGLVGKSDPLDAAGRLRSLEDRLESAAPDVHEQFKALRDELRAIEAEILRHLSDRLLARAEHTNPGYLIVNPCSFTRRVALELDRPDYALPLRDPVKACQLDPERMRVVVEVPALGFAWIPKSGPVGTPEPTLRMRLADERHVRNEFFEAQIDPNTGGLFSIADRRNPFGRVAQRLVFNPGSKMVAKSIKVTSVGPALGEVISEGVLLGEQEQELARFRQRFRAWLGRPILELRIEIFPEQPPAGHPWHAYFGCRFAWPEERSLLFRGVNGVPYPTYHTRPQTADYLEVRSHRLRTCIFPGGLPFIQLHDARMADIILIPQGETSHTFDLAIGLERDYPMQTALGLISPVSMIATEKGPPHIGAAGWLYHLDTPNLLLTSMRPGRSDRNGATIDDGVEDAITLRLFEAMNQSGQAEFRCVRNPTQAVQLDGQGDRLVDLAVEDDRVMLEVTPGDFAQVQIEFG